MTYTLKMIDICLPDYFAGSSEIVLQIPIYKAMTLEEIKEALQAKLNYNWEHYEYYCSPELLDSAIEALTTGEASDYRYFKEVPKPRQQDEWAVNAYFVALPIGDLCTN